MFYTISHLPFGFENIILGTSNYTCPQHLEHRPDRLVSQAAGGYIEADLVMCHHSVTSPISMVYGTPVQVPVLAEVNFIVGH